jgi:hypothetical protein
VNEIVKIEQPNADVRAYRASTEAADICKGIVVATSSNIQGKRYVAVEGWQAIAIAHGCTLSAKDVERVEGGVRAIGEVHRMSDGQLISTGEGFVGEDETTWFGGKDKRGKMHDKRADYAIRAMAQTRAMSRAGRTAFAHVVVMMNAGLATTPAEEMIAIDGETGEFVDADPKIPGITKIKNNLNKLMREGRKIRADEVGALEAFNALVHDCKDDLQTIKDANHSYWTGDGEDFGGLKAWIKQRREELTPKEESLGFQFLCSCVESSKSADDLNSLMDQHSEAIGELDGEEMGSTPTTGSSSPSSPTALRTTTLPTVTSSRAPSGDGPA